MAISSIQSTESFESDVLKSDSLALCVFTADWCPYCKTLEPKIVNISSALPDLNIYNLDVDKAKGVDERYGVNTIPTIIFFRNGEPVSQEMVAYKTEPELMDYVREQIKDHG